MTRFKFGVRPLQDNPLILHWCSDRVSSAMSEMIFGNHFPHPRRPLVLQGGERLRDNFINIIKTESFNLIFGNVERSRKSLV